MNEWIMAAVFITLFCALVPLLSSKSGNCIIMNGLRGQGDQIAEQSIVFRGFKGSFLVVLVFFFPNPYRTALLRC
jgi:hypothetical protein